MCLIVRSLNNHLEDFESLVFSLESPPLALCVTQTWLLKNDKKVAAGYKQLEAGNRDERSGGAMINVREIYNNIKSYPSLPKESVFVLFDFSGFRLKVMCI